MPLYSLRNGSWMNQFGCDYEDTSQMKHWLIRTFRQAAWAPLAIFVFYAVAAKGFDAYILFPWLDMPTHFFGGVAITYFFSIGTGHAQAMVGRIPPVIQMFLSLGLTAITAVVWEFLEFLSDIVLGTKMDLGVSDTLSDLFFGLFGGAVFISLIWFFERNLNNQVPIAAKELKSL